MEYQDLPNSYPRIQVFVTKSKKFRARIKEDPESVPYAVTIGGESWENGKGRSLEPKIMQLICALRKNINREFERVFNQNFRKEWNGND